MSEKKETLYQKIVKAFIAQGYLTSADLVEIAGFRYGARLYELRKRGFDFKWSFKKNIENKKTHTTIYVMTTNREFIDVEKVSVLQW